MKLGSFYELQYPRPWEPDGERNGDSAGDELRNGLDDLNRAIGRLGGFDIAVVSAAGGVVTIV